MKPVGNFFQPWRYNPFTPFGPTIEPVAPNAFLSEEPVKLLAKGLVKNLPWLVGLAKDEGLYPAAGDSLVLHRRLLSLTENPYARPLFRESTLW